MNKQHAKPAGSSQGNSRLYTVYYLDHEAAQRLHGIEATGSAALALAAYEELIRGAATHATKTRSAKKRMPVMPRQVNTPQGTLDKVRLARKAHLDKHARTIRLLWEHGLYRHAVDVVGPSLAQVVANLERPFRYWNSRGVTAVRKPICSRTSDSHDVYVGEDGTRMTRLKYGWVDIERSEFVLLDP